jgi:hypothetical protein
MEDTAEILQRQVAEWNTRWLDAALGKIKTVGV